MEKLAFLNNIKEARIEKKLSQTELANAVGVSRNTISSIETGQYSPTAKLACALCIALDRSFEELFFFEGYSVNRNRADVDKHCNINCNDSTLSDVALHKACDFLSGEGWSAEKILRFIMYLTDKGE